MLATDMTGEELVKVVLSASMPPTLSLWAKYHDPTVMAVMLSLASLSHAVVQKNCAAASRAGVR